MEKWLGHETNSIVTFTIGALYAYTISPTNYLTLIIDRALSMVVPGWTSSSPTGAITNIPKRNRSKSTITTIATIIKIIVQSVPSISKEFYW